MWEKGFRSVCPVCDRPIEGRYFEDGGRILMRKACPEHGEVTDLASPDARLFIEKMALASEDYSERCSLTRCGQGIGACASHLAKRSPITFIELTPRCNMQCPVCYIDASTRGEDLPFEDVERMVGEIKRSDPETHLVLIGGEPTIHRDFFRILDLLKREGLIKRCYLATNGITLADEDFCRRIFEMGIRWIYLAFDATDREICRRIRGSYRSYEASRKAIENLRPLRRMRVVLAVTVVKGLNDGDLGNVVDFALENRDTVKRISISAEVYCGRQTTSEDLLRNRVTAEHIEGVLREKLGVRMPTMSLAVVGVLLAPLKAAGIIRSGYWVETMPHPLCGNIGVLGKRPDGRITSLIDLAVRRPERVYRYAARVERLAARMRRRREALARTA
ncbi:MAG: radical SAM protein, partial [Planctomycetes bacterium]|nr:radical SAM protein [Planctomycetota bacterium]